MRGVLMAMGCLVLSGCMGLVAEKHTYRSGGTVEVGGAEVGIAFRPEGTRGGNFALSAMVVGGAYATLDGPFAWRVEAYGKEGEHETLTLHRIRTRTALTGQDEWYPSEHLGGAAKFRRVKNMPGVVRARYPIPGLLKVKPEEDGRLDVWVDLTVRGAKGAQRKMVRFTLDPDRKRADQMIFLPTEVVKSIGTPLEDQEDPMWD